MVYYGILQYNTQENAMPRRATPFSINPADRPRIEEVFACKGESRRRVDRCRILLGLEAGKSAAELSLQCSVTPNTVRNVRRRYEAHGLAFLDDLPRSGHPFRYTPDDEAKILAQIDEPPPPGRSSWDGASLASALGFSDDFVWATLRKHGICLQRRRSWCVSTDPEFDRKAADVVGLYLNPPENAIVISIDEKPGIQALTRKQGFVHGRDGRVLRAYKSTYRRNGTLNLFAALKVAGGEVFGKVTQRKTREDFLSFMDALLADHQAGKPVPRDAADEVEYHVILDNYCIHKKNDAWLLAHPNVHFHYTPTSASWLNQVEIWFNIMSRKVLRDSSFDSKDQLKEAIEEYIAEYSKHPRPFVWRKREVHGSQIADKLKNLRN